MHGEMGYWRVAQDGTVELVIAHTFGITEIEEGTADGSRITLVAKKLERTSTAREILGLSRTFEVSDDTLVYELQMDFGRHGLQPHLRATLRKKSQEQI